MIFTRTYTDGSKQTLTVKPTCPLAGAIEVIGAHPVRLGAAISWTIIMTRIAS